eukprot:m51a1_g5150 hypothetical protein (1539) ;mRNA; f:44898-49868
MKRSSREHDVERGLSPTPKRLTLEHSASPHVPPESIALSGPARGPQGSPPDSETPRDGDVADAVDSRNPQRPAGVHGVSVACQTAVGCPDCRRMQELLEYVLESTKRLRAARSPELDDEGREVPPRLPPLPSRAARTDAAEDSAEPRDPTEVALRECPETEERVVRAALHGDARMQLAECKRACLRARRLVLSGHAIAALPLVRLLRVLIAEQTSEYESLLAALALVAAWPSAHDELREAVTAELDRAARARGPMKAVQEILCHGWHDTLAPAPEGMSRDEILTRAEFLSYEGRHELAIEVARSVDSMLNVLRFQIAASMWEQAVMTVQSQMNVRQWPDTVKMTLMKEYGAGVLPLKFLMSVALPMLMKGLDPVFTMWTVRESFSNRLWAAQSRARQQAILATERGACARWQTRSGLGSLKEMCAVKVSRAFQEYEPYSMYQLLCSLGSADDVVASLCCACVSIYILERAPVALLSKAVAWMSSRDPVTALAWAKRRLELATAPAGGPHEGIDAFGGQMLDIACSLGIRGFENVVWYLLRRATPEMLRMAASGLERRCELFAQAPEHTELSLLVAVLTLGNDTRSFSRAVERMAMATSEEIAVGAANYMARRISGFTITAEEYAGVLLSSELYGSPLFLRAQAVLFRTVWWMLQEKRPGLGTNDARNHGSTASALSKDLAVSLFKQKKLLDVPGLFLKLTEFVAGEACRMHALVDIATGCRALLPPDTLFEFVRNALGSAASHGYAGEASPPDYVLGTIVLDYLNNTESAKAAKKLVTLPTTAACERNGGCVLYVAERTAGWKGLLGSTMTCLEKLALHCKEHRRRAMDLLADLSSRLDATAFCGMLHRVCSVVPSHEALDRLGQTCAMLWAGAVPPHVRTLLLAMSLASEPSERLVKQLRAALPAGVRDAHYDQWTRRALAQGSSEPLRSLALALRTNGNDTEAYSVLLAKRSSTTEPLLQELAYDLYGAEGVADVTSTYAAGPDEDPDAASVATKSAVALLLSKGHKKCAVKVALKTAFGHCDLVSATTALETAALASEDAPSPEMIVHGFLGQHPTVEWQTFAAAKCYEVGFVDTGRKLAHALLAGKLEAIHVENLWRHAAKYTRDPGQLMGTFQAVITRECEPKAVETIARVADELVPDKPAVAEMVRLAAARYFTLYKPPLSASGFLIWAVKQQGPVLPPNLMAVQLAGWLPLLTRRGAVVILKTLHETGNAATSQFGEQALSEAATDDPGAWGDGLAWALAQNVLSPAVLAKIALANADRLGPAFAGAVQGLMDCLVATAQERLPKELDLFVPVGMIVATTGAAPAKSAVELAKWTGNAPLRRKSVLGLIHHDASAVVEASGLQLPQETVDALAQRSQSSRRVALLLQLPDAREFHDLAMCIALAEEDVAERAECLKALDDVFGSLTPVLKERFFIGLDSIVWRDYRKHNPAADATASLLVKRRKPELFFSHEEMTAMRAMLKQKMPPVLQTYQIIIQALNSLHEIHRVHSRREGFKELCDIVCEWQSDRKPFQAQLRAEMVGWGLAAPHFV